MGLVSEGYRKLSTIMYLILTGSEDLDERQTYLWSVLYATGYLTDAGRPKNGVYKLVIPNREVLGIYEKRIRSWYGG